MRRRRFLHNLAVGAAGISYLPSALHGRDAKVAGDRKDTVLISTGLEKQFDIRAQYDAS